jgi:hypothetical protein
MADDNPEGGRKTMTHSTIARSHFNARTLRALTRQGIRLVGIQAAPAFDGDLYFTGTAYVLDVCGECRIRSYGEVLALAA